MADGGTTLDPKVEEVPVVLSPMEELKVSCTLGGAIMLVVGLVVGFIAGLFDSDVDWTKQAILHHAGAYDEHTGNFYWFDQYAQ